MKINFNATVPEIQSAIKISGNGAVRLQLDIPESELGSAIKIVAAQGKVLNVTMEWDETE